MSEAEGPWETLIKRQRQERIDLVQLYAAKGLTKSQSAFMLGMYKQALHQFAKKHNIRFAKGR